MHRVEWSADRAHVKLYGTGFAVEMRVDAQEVQVTADLPFLGGLLGGPFMAGLKGIVKQTFHKRLK